MKTKKLGQVIKFCSVIRISRRINFFLKDLMNKKVSHGLNRESLLRQPIKFCPVVGISNCRKLFEGLNQNDLAEKCGSHSFSRHDSSSENTQISLGEHTENTQRTQVPRRAIAIFSSCNSWSSRCNFLRFAVSLLSTFGIWIWIC